MSIVKKHRRLAPLTFRTLTPRLVKNLDSYAALPVGYYPTNPSFVDLPIGRLISIRGCNYTMTPDRQQIFTVGSGYKSVSRFVLMSEGELQPLNGLNTVFDNAEDMRLFIHDNEPWCVFTDAKNNGKSGVITLARLDIFRQRAELFPLSSPYGFAVEKNWSPFCHFGAIHFIYSFQPLVILRFDQQRGSVNIVENNNKKIDRSNLRFLLAGSSSGILENGSIIFIAHRRSMRILGMHKIYLHRVVRLSTDLNQVKMGPYFSIGKAEVQFVAGYHRSLDTVTLSYGRLDNHACLAEFDISNFDQLDVQLQKIDC